MDKDFDFNRIGKRMPYTTPHNFLEEMEHEVWKEIGNGAPHPARKQRSHLHMAIGAMAIAASMALLLVINLQPHTGDADGLLKVEQAFANLCNEDQAYMLEIYQDDIFIND